MFVYILACKWILDSGKDQEAAKEVRCNDCREHLSEGNRQRRSATHQTARILTISWKLPLAQFQRGLVDSRILHVHRVSCEWKVQGKNRSVESVRGWQWIFPIPLQSNPAQNTGSHQHPEIQSRIYSWANCTADFPQSLLQQHGNGDLSWAGQEVGVAVNVDMPVAEKTRRRVRKSARMA